MKSSRTLFVLILAASLTLTAIFASPLAAKTRYIWPGDLVPERLDLAYNQRQASISLLSGSNQRNFFAPVKLPAGAVMTRVEIFYEGLDDDSDLSVILARVKMGEDPWTSLLDELVTFNPTGSTGGEVTSMSSTNILSPKIQKNLLYYLYLELRADHTAFYRAKIYYNK